MAAAEEVQALLRFLTKDAHLPLAEAMPKIQALRKLGLATPDKISKADHADLKIVFTDEKVLKQVTNAAKRTSKPKKQNTVRSRPEANSGNEHQTEEDAVALPVFDGDEKELQDITIETNRAPLFLAFTVTVLKYTQPRQPVSSRLSLAQAVVSAGAQSRAKYLGITNGPTAEEDGWAQGQPKIRIMGRDVAVMRRQVPTSFGGFESRDTAKTEDERNDSSLTHEAFWGIDLEALRKSNGPLIAGKNVKGHAGPPIYQPQAARNYLLKAMNVVRSTGIDMSPKSKQSNSRKSTTAEILAGKEEAAAMMLKAIDIICASWAETLGAEELDKRAQTWYARVRPAVADGQAGWGQRGHVQLQDILKLRRNG